VGAGIEERGDSAQALVPSPSGVGSFAAGHGAQDCVRHSPRRAVSTPQPASQPRRQTATGRRESHQRMRRLLACGRQPARQSGKARSSCPRPARGRRCSTLNHPYRALSRSQAAESCGDAAEQRPASGGGAGRGLGRGLGRWLRTQSSVGSNDVTVGAAAPFNPCAARWAAQRARLWSPRVFLFVFSRGHAVKRRVAALTGRTSVCRRSAVIRWPCPLSRAAPGHGTSARCCCSRARGRCSRARDCCSRARGSRSRTTSCEAPLRALRCLLFSDCAFSAYTPRGPQFCIA